ncbi:MAG: hypothetical protein WA948_10415 [Pontixanthobacter sp.]
MALIGRICPRNPRKKHAFEKKTKFKTNLMKKTKKTQKQHQPYASEQNFAHYFAGLWEGDGNVALKADRQKITLHITMSLDQSPFLTALLSRLKLKLTGFTMLAVLVYGPTTTAPC